MSGRHYDEFFHTATGHQPFGYQRRLCGGDSGASCQSKLIDIPTGLGKTAAVVLAWLWNRVQLQNEEWPRRLVYCLPMRTLVEQTRDNVCEWLKSLGDLEWNPKYSHKGKIGLHILMGGEEREENPWDLYPEEDAILIGTQDMLLSRALNRGYAMSRYRWPMHFGLLSNDCLWIFDEVQLMGNGLATGIQLDAFRSVKLWSTSKPCVTWWMSATQSSTPFDTTDRKELGLPGPELFQLMLAEQEDVKGRLGAEKHVQLSAKPPKPAEILASHRPGQLSLLVTNTVKSALHWYSELTATPQGDRFRKPSTQSQAKQKMPELVLLHSRFRPRDRRQRMARLDSFLSSKKAERADHPGMIVVSTQVIEAGVDISAAALWSEIAPWSSVIQRLGRLNRDGQQRWPANAIFWMPKGKEDEDTGESKNTSRIGPYDKNALNISEALLKNVIEHQDSGSRYRIALDTVLSTEKSKAALDFELGVVIRPDDVYGLFSSEPDLAGGFSNISPFVRNTRDSADVSVYWRDFKGQPSVVQSNTSHEELVQVPAYVLANFLKDHQAAACVWDEETGAWNRTWPNEVVPGMTILLPAQVGGYSSRMGWTGDPKDIPDFLGASVDEAYSLFGDTESEAAWQTLSEHTAAVASEAAAIARDLSLPKEWMVSLQHASEWHDVGKAHRRWQSCLPPYPQGGGGPWGKFSGRFNSPPKVRHEAFSLMAAWQEKMGGHDEISSLVLYLVASHHGKVRTLLRSTNGSDVFGWTEGDDPLEYHQNTYSVDVTLRSFAAASQIDWEKQEYRFVRPAWGSVVEELLGPAWITDGESSEAIPSNEPRRLGPFALAYAEAVFRAADARASRGSKQ